MIERIVLNNFMAHEHSVLELGPGLNVLTGPNNTGKSAVVEALRCVAENPAPRQHIRHGAKEARVEVHLEDGWRVVWVRTKTHPRYEIWAPGAEEPEVWAKTGRKVPEEVQALLRMPLVRLEESNRDIDVHLGNQRYPIFLLDQPGSAFAQFFAASTESAHLLAMQDLLKDKSKEAKRTLRESEKRRRRLEDELDRLAPLPDLELRSQAAEELLERIRTAEARIPRLQELLQALRQQRHRLRQMQRLEQVLAGLQTPGALAAVAPLARLLEQQARQRRLHALARQRQQVVAPLQSPPALFPAAEIKVMLERMAAARDSAKRLQVRASGLQRLAGPPSLYPAGILAARIKELASLKQGALQAQQTAGLLQPLHEVPQLFPLRPLRRLCASQQELLRRRQELQRHAAAAAALEQPPGLHDLAPLEKTLDGLKALQRQREILAEGAAQRERELQDCHIRLDARLREVGACPLCGGDLETGRFLEQGHSHE